MPFMRFITFTYMPLPEMHFDSLLRQDSSLQHTRSFLHQVYFCAHAQCARRIRIRWAEASCGTGDHPCQSPPAHHPCTTQWWALAGPRPYSSTWWALPWRQWHRKGAPQSAGESLPGEDEILQNVTEWRQALTFLIYSFCFTEVHIDKIKLFNHSNCTYYYFIYVSVFCSLCIS